MVGEIKMKDYFLNAATNTHSFVAGILLGIITSTVAGIICVFLLYVGEY
jgi:hypothetical protein